MFNSVGVQTPTELKRSARMRTDSVRNLSAKADPNPARKTRKRVLTIIEDDFRNNQYSNEEYLDNIFDRLEAYRKAIYEHVYTHYK